MKIIDNNMVKQIAVQFQKGGKYYYNIEINKKKTHT